VEVLAVQLVSMGSDPVSDFPLHTYIADTHNRTCFETFHSLEPPIVYRQDNHRKKEDYDKAFRSVESPIVYRQHHQPGISQEASMGLAEPPRLVLLESLHMRSAPSRPKIVKLFFSSSYSATGSFTG